MSRPSHIERTVAEPRQTALHRAQISSIRYLNSRIRAVVLTLPCALEFLPGQWLDVHVPGITKAGGFTITSSPSTASARTFCSEDIGTVPTRSLHLELAIQNAPSNPAAEWLWQPQSEILHKELQIRVGGSFTWPPLNVDVRAIDELVLIAGGVGVNPLISIVTFLHEQLTAKETHGRDVYVPNKLTMLYGSKLDSHGISGLPFSSQIKRIMSSSFNHPWSCRMFLTGQQNLEEGSGAENDGKSFEAETESHISVRARRMDENDILQTYPCPKNRQRVCTYVCGPPSMTDAIVSYLKSLEGMRPEHVLCEKWW